MSKGNKEQVVRPNFRGRSSRIIDKGSQVSHEDTSIRTLLGRLDGLGMTADVRQTDRPVYDPEALGKDWERMNGAARRQVLCANVSSPIPRN
jgi:hypothetical protein